jgi:hypothetical protein
VAPIFWIRNWSESSLRERAGLSGSLQGREGQGVFVQPPASAIAKRLAADPLVTKVLIAYHPMKPEKEAMTRDMLLGEFAASSRRLVDGELRKLKPDGWSVAVERLTRGKIEFTAKCLRQEPSDRPQGSFLFDKLAAVASAGDDEQLGMALEDLEAEFARDRTAELARARSGRDALLLDWHLVTNPLCVLDLDLSALSILAAKDHDLGGSQAVRYLGELVQETREARGETPQSVKESVHSRLKEVAARTGHAPPDLAAIDKVLDLLTGFLKVGPRTDSRADLDRLLGLVEGEQGFSVAVGKVSTYFSTLLATAGGGNP